MMTFVAARLFSAVAAVFATATITLASAPQPHAPAPQSVQFEIAGLAVPNIAA